MHIVFIVLVEVFANRTVTQKQLLAGVIVPFNIFPPFMPHIVSPIYTTYDTCPIPYFWVASEDRFEFLAQ